MNVFIIAINLLFLNLFYFSKNVSGLRRSSAHEKPSNDSFLQVKSTLGPENGQQPLVPGQVPQPAPVASDTEGLKKAVAASVLASQGLTPTNGQLTPPNGPLNPSDVTNLQPVVPSPPVNPVTNQQLENLLHEGGVGEGTPEKPLNVLLDPSLQNISDLERNVKNYTEKSVHDLKKSLEGFTELSALLDPHKDNETFYVDGDDYNVKTTLDLMNKSLKQLESLQKVLFQANAFVLKEVTKNASGSTLNDNKNN